LIQIMVLRWCKIKTAYIYSYSSANDLRDYSCIVMWM